MEKPEKSFGEKMLESMGWSESKPIGRNPHTYRQTIHEIPYRKVGQGLGKPAPIEDEVEKSNRHPHLFKMCSIVHGEHKGLKGVITDVKNSKYTVEINSAQVEVDSDDLLIDGKRIERDPFDLRRKLRKNRIKQTGIRKPFGFQFVGGVIVQLRAKEGYLKDRYLSKARVIDAIDKKLILLFEDGEYVEGVSLEEVGLVEPILGQKCYIGTGEHCGKKGTFTAVQGKRQIGVFDGEEGKLFIVDKNQVSLIEE